MDDRQEITGRLGLGRQKCGIDDGERGVVGCAQMLNLFEAKSPQAILVSDDDLGNLVGDNAVHHRCCNRDALV